MALLPIHLLGSPVLREQSATIDLADDGTKELVADLFETMDAAEGVGLAANQVGVARRVAVVGIDDDRLVLINPVILESDGKDTASEVWVVKEHHAARVARWRMLSESADHGVGFSTLFFGIDLHR